jgi:hypothetical protein
MCIPSRRGGGGRFKCRRWWGKEEVRIRTRISSRTAGSDSGFPSSSGSSFCGAGMTAAKKVATNARLVKVLRVILNPKAKMTKG